MREPSQIHAEQSLLWTRPDGRGKARLVQDKQTNAVTSKPVYTYNIDDVSTVVTSLYNK